MYVVQPEGGLKREFPHHVLCECFRLGALHQRVHRPFRRVFHHDAQPVTAGDEGFVVPDDVRVVELGEHAALVDGVLLVSARGAHGDLFHHVRLFLLHRISSPRHRVDHAEGPFTELALDLEVLQPGGVGPGRDDHRWFGHPRRQRGHAGPVVVGGGEHHRREMTKCVGREKRPAASFGCTTPGGIRPPGSLKRARRRSHSRTECRAASTRARPRAARSA